MEMAADILAHCRFSYHQNPSRTKIEQAKPTTLLKIQKGQPPRIDITASTHRRDGQ